MTLISIIMPVYNGEKYLTKAIESVLNQSIEDFELIIVNDGSTDQSLSIIEHFSLIDFRIKIITQLNKGPSAARNTGLKIAGGDYICFIDGDDEVNPDLLKNVLIELKPNYPDVLMFGMWIEDIGRDEKIRATFPMRTGSADYTKEQLDKVKIDKNFLDLIGYSTNKMYKRQLLISNAIMFDEDINFLEDMKFNKHIFENATSLKIIDQCLYHYKRRKNSSGANTFQMKYFDLHMQAIEFRKEIFDKWGIEDNQIETAIVGLHMFAIKATCSVLFKHSHLTFNEKCQYINTILLNPLTTSRIKKFSTYTVADKLFKHSVEKKQVYTLAFVSSLLSLPYKMFNNNI